MLSKVEKNIKHTQDEYLHTNHHTAAASSCAEQQLFKSKEFIAYRECYEKASRGEDYDFPIHLEMENIYACNLHCPHCAREHIEDVAVQTMDIELYKKVIEEGASIGTRSVGFAEWGEVFLDKNIFEKIDFAREKGILDFRLHSNGILITDEIAENIVKSGITWMSISLDACTPETYALTRGGDYDKAVNALGKIVSAKLRLNSVLPNLRVSFVKTSMNEHEVEIFERTFGQYFDVAIQDFRDPNRLMPKSLEPQIWASQDYDQCLKIFKNLSIRADGRVSACCEDIESKIILGNVREDSLYDIYNGDLVRDLKRQHKEKKITDPQCIKCLGGCA